MKGSNFVAVIMDETTDVSTKSQLSTVFRYISSERKVKERFLGLTDVSSDWTTVRLSDILFDTIDQFQCSQKIIEQTYDGAPVMPGPIRGLQALVKEKYLETGVLFVHCYDHRLSLVLQKSASFKRM